MTLKAEKHSAQVEHTSAHHPRLELDEAIHQPVRLSLMALLAQSERVDFAFLRDYLELGDSNLSRHLSALESLDYINIEKVFEGKRGRTWVSLSAAGREAFAQHVRVLRQIVDVAPAPAEKAPGAVGGNIMKKHTAVGALVCALFALLLCLAASAPVRAFDEDHSKTINGTVLHFRVRGTDKNHRYLVLLHGGPGFSSAMFLPWASRLEKTVNVVYLDQRGSGQSARLHFASPYAPTDDESKDYTIANLIADMEGVRQSLGVEKWYVLGHSWGGMLGLEYTAAHPERVRGLIDMDGLMSVPAMTLNILDNAQAKFEADKKAGLPNADDLLTRVATLRALPHDNPQRLLGAFGLALGPAQLYFTHDQSGSFSAFNAQIAKATRAYNLSPADLAPASEPTVALIINDHFLTRDDTPLLAKIAVPALVINGKQDGVISPQSAEAAQRAMPHAQMVLLNNCGHFPFAEQPDKAAKAVEEFVARTSVWTNPDLAQPVVPSLAGVRASDIQRPCVIGFVVGTDGHITDVQVKRSSGNAAFDAACLAAVQKGHGQPAVHNGLPAAAPGEYSFQAG